MQCQGVYDLSIFIICGLNKCIVKIELENSCLLVFMFISIAFMLGNSVTNYHDKFTIAYVVPHIKPDVAMSAIQMFYFTMLYHWHLPIYIWRYINILNEPYLSFWRSPSRVSYRVTLPIFVFKFFVKHNNLDSKVHGANMGPTWVLSALDGPHVAPMNLAIRECIYIFNHCARFTCQK